MVDLHTHTIHSDGTWTTKRLLEEAEKAKLDYISITDHNSVRAYYDINDSDICNIYRGKIIPGCEFSCNCNGSKLELLGYNIDIEETNKWVSENYNNEEYSFQDEFAELIRLCKKHGIKFSENLSYDFDIKYPYDILYQDIIKYPDNRKFFKNNELDSPNNFFRSASCNKKNPLYIDFGKTNPTAKEVACFIRSTGGIVFIAHTFVYNLNKPLEVLKELMENKLIDGIEVYHTDHSEEQVNVLLDVCRKNNLLISGGSDCHGDKRIARKIGKSSQGNPILAENVIDLLNLLKNSNKRRITFAE